MDKTWLALSILALLLLAAISGSGCLESESDPVLGDYAKSYLQDKKYKRIIIEMDYVEGFQPSADANDMIKSRIGKYCDKTENTLIFQDAITATKSQYTDDDIRSLEEKNRNYKKTSKDIIIYVLYLNGEYNKDSDVLGLAYGPSSIAIFKERIDDIPIPLLAGNQLKSSDYESSVLVHEFGHLLALVNINYESERNHESAYQHHCIHDECVMYHMIETTSILDLVTQEDPKPPSDFCSDCRDDLSKLKSGHY